MAAKRKPLKRRPATVAKPAAKEPTKAPDGELSLIERKIQDAVEHTAEIVTLKKTLEALDKALTATRNRNEELEEHGRRMQRALQRLYYTVLAEFKDSRDHQPSDDLSDAIDATGDVLTAYADTTFTCDQCGHTKPIEEFGAEVGGNDRAPINLCQECLGKTEE